MGNKFDYRHNNPSPAELASLLGRMAKGKPKRLSKQQRKQSAERLALARENRWK